MFASKDPMNHALPHIKKAAENHLLLGLIGEIKQNIQLNDKSFDSIIPISDEFFAILIHLLQFSTQIINTLKKRQSYDKLLIKIKNSLSEEISSFFDNLSGHQNSQSQSKASTSSSLNISTEYSFTIGNIKSPKFAFGDLDENSFLQCEELSNENIIEKIKRKIEKKQNLNMKSVYPTSVPSPKNKPEKLVKKEKKKEKSKETKKEFIKEKLTKLEINPENNIQPILTDEKKERKRTRHLSVAVSQPQRLSTFTNSEMINNFRDKLDNSLIQQNERLNTSMNLSTNQELIIKHCLNIKAKQNVPRASNYANYLLSKYKGVIDVYNNKICEKRSSSNSVTHYNNKSRKASIKLSKN